MPSAEARKSPEAKKDVKPTPVKAPAKKPLKNNSVKRAAKPQAPEEPSGMPPEDFMNAPVNEDGLPFA